MPQAMRGARRQLQRLESSSPKLSETQRRQAEDFLARTELQFPLSEFISDIRAVNSHALTRASLRRLPTLWNPQHEGDFGRPVLTAGDNDVVGLELLPVLFTQVAVERKLDWWSWDTKIPDSVRNL